MKFIQEYKGFTIWDNRGFETITSYPITLKYNGRFVDTYSNVLYAQDDVDRMPSWLRTFMQRWGPEPAP